MAAIGTASKGANLAKGLANYLGGSSVTGSAGAADAASMASGWAAPEISQTGALAGIDADTGLATANTASDIAASNDAWLASQAGATAEEGAAGGAAAGEGAAAGGSAAGEGVAGGQAAASGSGLGAGAGAAAAFAPLALTLWASQKYPAVQLGADYWHGLENNLQAGRNNPQFYGAAMEALNMPQNQVPQAIQQEIWNSGYAPQGQWGMQAPSAAQQRDFVNQTGVQLSGGGKPRNNV
jgi:hypothetical protein